MKKITLMTLMVLALCTLGGCKQLVEIRELSDEETEMVTEYAAGLVLKYDASYEGALLSDDELVKAEAEEARQREIMEKYRQSAEDYLAKKQNADKSSKKEKSDKTASEGAEVAEMTVDNIAAFYGLDGFSVSYNDYSLTKSYPDGSREDFFMALDANPGYQFLVAKFNVTNTSGADADFDMFSRSTSFQAVINGSEKVKSQMTLLLDDMSSYKGMIAPGESTEMVLIFEIPEDMGSVDSLKLSIKNGDAKGSMILK